MKRRRPEAKNAATPGAIKGDSDGAFPHWELPALKRRTGNRGAAGDDRSRRHPPRIVGGGLSPIPTRREEASLRRMAKDSLD